MRGGADVKRMDQALDQPAGRADTLTSTDRILDATEKLICEVGYSRLSLRSVAARAELALGTVSYVFKTKEALIDAFVDRLLRWYTTNFEGFVILSTDQRKSFFDVVRFLISDLRSERTSRLFPELWAMANHNAHVQDVLDGIYRTEREWLERLLRAGWPDLPSGRLRMIVGTLIPMIEGHAIFIPPQRTQPYPEVVAEEAIISWLKSVLED